LNKGPLQAEVCIAFNLKRLNEKASMIAEKLGFEYKNLRNIGFDNFHDIFNLSVGIGEVFLMRPRNI